MEERRNSYNWVGTVYVYFGVLGYIPEYFPTTRFGTLRHWGWDFTETTPERMIDNQVDREGGGGRGGGEEVLILLVAKGLKTAWVIRERPLQGFFADILRALERIFSFPLPCSRLMLPLAPTPQPLSPPHFLLQLIPGGAKRTGNGLKGTFRKSFSNDASRPFAGFSVSAVNHANRRDHGKMF